MRFISGEYFKCAKLILVKCWVTFSSFGFYHHLSFVISIIFVGPLIPLFWTSCDICPGFQSQGGNLACFLTCMILRFTSGVTPADCIEVSMVAKPFRSTYLQICPQALVEVQGIKPMTVCAASTVLYTIRPLRLGACE